MAFRKGKGADSPRITPSKAKNAVAVARIIGPAVLPVLAPYVTRTAGTVRDRWDRLRARRLGIAIDDLATYSGRGGALHARIAGIDAALAELRDAGYSEATTTRLRQLTAAVRAAERMPTARRRSAHRAVAAELDRTEQEVLRRLGIQPEAG